MTDTPNPVPQDPEVTQSDMDSRILRIACWMILITFSVVAIALCWQTILDVLIGTLKVLFYSIVAISILFLGTKLIALLWSFGWARWTAMVKRRRDSRVQRLKRYATIDAMMQLGPTEFERLVLDYFAVQGYEVEATGGRGDEGIDGILRRNGETELLQCKRYNNPIGPPPIRDFYGVINKKRVRRGWFVTTSRFTSAATDWAGDLHEIKLIDGPTLVERINRL